MRSTKLMLLGALFMLLGVGIAVALTPTLLHLVSLEVLNALPGLESGLIIVGFIIGVVGFVQKPEA